MKKFMKKAGSLTIVGLMGVSLLATTNFAFASDDNVGYSFQLEPNQGNDYTSSRYRQTENTNNEWKVNHNYSEEGSGTIATFWLTNTGSGYTQVSAKEDVKQGTGAHYFDAYETASKAHVSLTVENNNYSSNTYDVSGYWDEETS